jgi:hypothetical protein
MILIPALAGTASRPRRNRWAMTWCQASRRHASARWRPPRETARGMGPQAGRSRDVTNVLRVADDNGTWLCS